MTIESAIRETISRIDRNEPALNAVAHRIDEIALADARRCDNSYPGTALHGVPFAVKDIIDVAGVPTHSGSLTRSDQQPAQADAPVVAGLRSAGAIPIVKTNTVEFAIGGWGTNMTVGTPHNPWDLTTHRVPGGSSSGTGVLVGAGILPAGLGTDTGGSVRIPAALCGCVGLKTSIGAVSRTGVTPLSGTLDTVGPLTQTVALAAAMFDAMQSRSSDDPTTLSNPCRLSAPGLNKGNQGLRLGVIQSEAMATMTPEVRDSFERALRLLEESGATLGACSVPLEFSDYQHLSGLISATEAYATYQDIADDQSSSLAPPNRQRMLAGKSVSAAELIKIHRDRVNAIADFENVIDRFDALVLPTAPTVAIPVADVDEADYSCSLYTRMANYLELSAIAVPVDLTPLGLPTSLQIVVRRFDDPLALRIAAGFEQVRGDFTPPQGLA